MEIYVSEIRTKKTFRSRPFNAIIERNATSAKRAYPTTDAGWKYTFFPFTNAWVAPIFKSNCPILVKTTIINVKMR